MKQETLEKVAERFYPTNYEVKSKDIINLIKQDSFKRGARWQQERMYSEEDMINFAKYILSKKVTIARSPLDVSSYLPKEFQLLSGKLEHDGKKLLKEWFEQFKNK
jgi:hypothetical protein